MAGKPQYRSRRRAARQRRRQRLLIGSIAGAALAVALILVGIGLFRSGGDVVVAPTIEPTFTPAPIVTEAPTVAPTATPTRTPAPKLDNAPNVLSFYHPEGKSYSPRVRMGDTYAAEWKKGQDIGSFEVIASDAERIEGDFFGDMFGQAWTAFADSDKCKIGYTLRYALDDGSEIKFSMLSPKHIEHTEYIECWLYDDYHREPHQSYSHLNSVGSDTLMTSIKLTCGSQIAHVQDIWLTAYVCSSLDDFDDERNYIGDTSCTIHITRA